MNNMLQNQMPVMIIGDTKEIQYQRMLQMVTRLNQIQSTRASFKTIVQKVNEKFSNDFLMEPEKKSTIK